MSRVLSWVFLLSIGLCLLTNNVVHAEDVDDADAGDSDSDTYDGDDEEFDDDEDAVSSSDVTVNTMFPRFADKKFPLGKEVTLLVSFNNNGEKSFNVSHIVAHLHSPFDYNYYIQNFTSKNTPATVPANSQVSLEYTFKPDTQLEPLEFWLSAVVAYNRSDGRGFMHTLHNGTVELVEAAEATNQRLVMYLVALLGLGGLGFVYAKSQEGAKETQKEVAVTGISGGSWDDDVIYKPSSTQKKAGRKGAKKKAN